MWLSVRDQRPILNTAIRGLLSRTGQPQKSTVETKEFASWVLQQQRHYSKATPLKYRRLYRLSCRVGTKENILKMHSNPSSLKTPQKEDSKLLLPMVSAMTALAGLSEWLSEILGSALSITRAPLFRRALTQRFGLREVGLSFGWTPTPATRRIIPVSVSSF